MKTRKIITLAALATLALSSCTNQEDPTADRDNSLLPHDRVIRVSAATTAPSPFEGSRGNATRAGMDAEELRRFTLTIDNATAPAYSYQNVKMQKSDGIWYSFANNVDGNDTPLTLLWSSATHPVTVTAYQPYVWASDIHDGVTPSEVGADQTRISGSSVSDLLWAKNEVTPADPEANNDIHYDPFTKSLVVQMNHLLSKLRVNLKYGSSLTQGSGDAPTLSAATLIGTRRHYKFTPATGEVAVNLPYDPQDIALSTAETPTPGFDAACEAIVVPQSATFSLRFTIGGQEYLYIYTPAAAGAAASYTFESGRIYTLDLTVGEITDTRAAGISAAGSRAVTATAFCSEEWNAKK